MGGRMARVEPAAVERVAVVGAGTIGAGWAAYFLARGLTVAVSDPDPAAEARLKRMVAQAWPVLEQLGLAPGADPGRLSFTTDAAAGAEGAQFVQENAPEQAELKAALFHRLEQALAPEVVVASSTSGLVMSTLRHGLAHPGRFIVGHPFNPPHLIPLVEVVGGEGTDPEAVDWTLAFYRAMGKQPIHLRKERPGHLANRLQAALWREAVSAVAEGMASVADVDAAIAYGPGLRWAVMGPHMIFHLGGGEAGMAGFLDHFGPPIESWWRDLGSPTLTPEIRQALIDGVADEAAGRDLTALADQRDACLIALLDALKRHRP